MFQVQVKYLADNFTSSVEILIRILSMANKPYIVIHFTKTVWLENSNFWDYSCPL